MKPHLLFAVPIFALAAAGCVRVSTASASMGDRRSRPVQVAEPPPAPSWTPPSHTSVPPALVERTRFLIAHGLGDPRGGEYRVAKVHLGTVWSRETQPVEIHGWVHPASGGAPAWVVATDGLTYEAVSVGGPADLDRDVAAMAASPRAFYTFIVPTTEETVGLLLLAGRNDLAEKLQAALPDHFFGLNFLGRWFDQAVTAHMRGDDRTALRVAQEIQRERPALERDALARNGQQTIIGPQGRTIRVDEQFPYLDVLPALIQDAERRLTTPEPALDLAQLRQKPVEEQVRTLVAHLDDVAAIQSGQPGGVNLIEDPIVARLVEIGKPAGEALIDAMQNDDRLTRSVGFGRDFFPGRNLISVKDAAGAALRAILQVDELPRGTDDRPSISAIRQYWQANKDKAPADRWFDTLADDHAGWRQWSEAATRLFDPVGLRRDGYFAWGATQGPIRAEPLRSRTGPSLSDLLEKRAREIAFHNGEGFSTGLMLPNALRMGLDLAKWDPPRSVSLLRDLTQASLAEMRARRTDPVTFLNGLIAAIVARHDAGDSTAWRDYVTTLEALNQAPFFDSKYLKPILDHPNDRELQPARKLLTTRGSALDAVGRIEADPRLIGIDNVLISPALKLPEVRSAALAALGDKRTIGATWADARGEAWVESNEKPSPSQGPRPKPGEPLPAPGVKRPLRAADAIAFTLSRLKGAPEFQPYWPTARKDAAIARIRAFFVATQNRVDLVLGWPNNWLDPEASRRLGG